MNKDIQKIDRKIEELDALLETDNSRLTTTDLLLFVIGSILIVSFLTCLGQELIFTNK